MPSICFYSAVALARGDNEERIRNTIYGGMRMKRGSEDR